MGGWFVDETPLQHEEFSADNAYHYSAHQACDTDNKMDLLTVLIHEIGNVLGLSHDQDNDVMTLRLSEGERRLPNINYANYLAWL